MTTIAPNDANILYSPYTWNVTGASAKTINAGAYFKTCFTGTPTTLTATFDVTNMATPNSRVGFRVDGGSWQDFDIAASINITMPGGNTWGKHTVEMVFVSSTETANRWAAPQNTAVVFTGLVADVTVTTMPVRARPMYGMCIGDSITEGVRTMNMNAATDPCRNDSRLAWAYPLGDLLGAEIGVVGFGNAGSAKFGAGGVPQYKDSVPYLWSGQARSLTTPKEPDFIVAHLGTNDNAATDADVTANTTTMLNGLTAATTQSTIIVLPGWLQRKAAAIQAGVAAANQQSRISYVDTTGWWNTADSSDALHPYGYINSSDLSPRLATVVQARMKQTVYTQFVRNCAGLPIPIA